MYKNIYICLIILFLAVINHSVAQQSDKATEEKALAYFNQNQYSEALPLFSQLLSLYPKDDRYNFYYAACLIETNQQIDKAIKYLQFAESKNSAPIIRYYLGRAYHLSYKFDEAINYYEQFRQLAPSKQVKDLMVQKLIDMCKNGQELIRYISDLTVVDNRRIKSENYFYSYDLKEFDGKLVVKPKELKSSVDKKEEPANMVIFLPNNSNIIYYGSYGNSKANGRDIYRIERLPDGKWSNPENLGPIINTPYDEDYPFLHADGKTLYFSSKGHNSMGGYDIFKSVFDSSTNSWTKPVNLDFPINTPYDDYLYIVDKDEFYAFFTSNRETRENNITVYKIIVDKNPVKREFKDIEEIINVSRLDVSPIAQIKKAEDSKQKTKSDEFQELVVSNQVVAEKTMLTPYTFKSINYRPGLTSQEVANELKADNEKILKNATELKRQSKLAYITARQNNEKANEKRKKAYDLNQQVKQEKDPVVAEQIKQEIYQLIDEAEDYERRAITAYNLAQNFESIALEMEKDVSKSQGFINAIEKQGNVDEAIVDAANKNKERLQLSQNKYSSLQKQWEERKSLQKAKENDLLAYEELFNQTIDTLNSLENEISRLKQRIDNSNSETEKNHLSLIVEQLNKQTEILEAKQIEIAEQKEKLKIDIENLNSENDFITEFAKQISEDQRTNEELQSEVINKEDLKKEIFDKELSADIAVANTVKEKVGKNAKTERKPQQQIAQNQTQQRKTNQQSTTNIAETSTKQPILAENTQIQQDKPNTTEQQENVPHIIKGVNPLLPSSESKTASALENYQKEQFNVQYYTNIINEQQQKLDILNNAIAKSKDKKQKELLEQQKRFLTEEIQANKQALAESKSKINQYKSAIASEWDTTLKISNEELVLQASKYDNKYEINFTPAQKRLLIENEQTIQETKNIEKQLIANNNEIKRIEQLKLSSNSPANQKEYENQLNELKQQQNVLLRDYIVKTEQANQKTLSIYNDILSSVRSYNFENENVKNASLLEKEIEALRDKSAQLKKESNLSQNYEDKLSLYKKASTIEQIAIEKQKYAIDLYVSGRQLTSQVNTSSITQPSEKISEVQPAQQETKQTEVKKSAPVSIELSPEENKQINEFQLLKSQADVKFEQGKTLYKEVEEKRQLAAQTYSAAKKKEILKDVDKKEQQALKLLSESHQVYENANKNKYSVYQGQINKLMQNDNINEENKQIASQFLKEAELFFEEAQSLRENSKTTTNTEEKFLLLNKAKVLEEKALANQEYAVDALTNTDPVVFVATNNLTKIDRLEALDKPIDVEDVVRIRTERIISNLSLTEEEKIKLDEAQTSLKTIVQLNTEAESYKQKLDVANEIAKKSTNPSEKKKAQKSIPKLEKEYFTRKFTVAELTEKVNDNLYQLYETKFADVRPKSNTQEAKQGKQLEKNANKLYIQAKQLRDRSFVTENPYLAYNYLLQADSLEKLAIEEQEKAYGLYLNLKPLEEELKEYAAKKQSKRPADELIVIKGPASITPISTERLAEITKEQEEKEKIKQVKLNTTQPEEGKIESTNGNKANQHNVLTQQENNKAQQEPVIKNDQTPQANEKEKPEERKVELTNEEDDKVNEPIIKNQIEKTETTQQPEQKITEQPVNTETEKHGEVEQQVTQLPEEKPMQTKQQTKEFTNEEKANLPITEKTTTTTKDLSENLIPKKVLTPMGFGYMPTSPYSDANPIPINPPLPEGLVFKVQIGAFNTPVKNDVFKGLSPVSAEKLPDSKYYRYFVGLFYSEAAAIMVRDYIKPMGYPDAFVVAFYNGKRITLFEARQLMKQVASPEYTRIIEDEKAKISAVTSIAPTDITQKTTQPATATQPFTSTGSLGPLVNQTQELFYTVQIGVYKNPVSREALKNLSPIYEDHSYGFIRYLLGKFADRKTAEAEKNKVVAAGITDAFVSAYYKGKKITLAEAANIEALNPNAVIKSSDNIESRGATNTQQTVVSNVDVQNLYFKVQVGLFKDKVPFDIAAKFVQVAGTYGLDQEQDNNGATIYYAGKFKSYEEAQKCKNDLINQGFNDAFIIATDGKQRVPIQQARQLLKP